MTAQPLTPSAAATPPADQPADTTPGAPLPLAPGALPELLTLSRAALTDLRQTLDAVDKATRHLPETTTVTLHAGGRVVIDAALPTWGVADPIARQDPPVQFVHTPTAPRHPLLEDMPAVAPPSGALSVGDRHLPAGRDASASAAGASSTPAPRVVARRALTPEDRPAILDLHAQGLDTSTIALRLGLVPQAVGVMLRHVREAAAKPMRDTRADDERRAAVARLVAQRKSVPEVAAALGLEPRTAAGLVVQAKRRAGASEDPSGGGNLWTAEEDARLLAMLRENATYQAISQALGRPFESTRKHGMRLIAGTDLARPQRRWSTDEDARLLAMVGEGATNLVIGEAVGCTVDQVKSRLSVLRARGVTIPARSKGGARPVAAPKVDDSDVEAFEAVHSEPDQEPASLPTRAIAVPKAPARVDDQEPSAPAEVQLPPREARPVFRPLAPVVAPSALSLAREVAAHLDAMPFDGGWGRDDDLALVEALTSGRRLPAVAEDLGFDERSALARWKSLMAPVSDPRGRPTIDGQAALLAELRRRATPMREAAE